MGRYSSSLPRNTVLPFSLLLCAPVRQDEGQVNPPIPSCIFPPHLTSHPQVETGHGREGDLVTVQHLRKVYPPAGGRSNKVAVDDLTMGVHANAIFAFLGTNG